MKEFEERQGTQEKEGKRNGIIVTVVVHAVLLFFFMITLAWQEPDPPIPQYGIEVNFGMTGTEGSKNIQNKSKPSDSESFEKAKPNPKPTPDPVEESKPTPKPDPVEESPAKEPVKEITPVTDEADKGVEAPKEDKKKPDPKPDDSGGAKSDNDGTADDDITNNEGKKEDGVGDRGKEDGNIDSDALVSSGGKGGSAKLNMDGWGWDEEPKATDSSSETGKVVIKFKIDQDGIVVSSTIYSRTVSYTTADFYRKKVESLTFHQVGGGGRTPLFTLGSITFVIKSK